MKTNLEFTRLYKLSLRFTAIILSIFLFLGFVVYPKNPIYNGLIFGTTISLIYVFLLALRIKKLDQVPLEKMAGFMKVGSMMRFALVFVSLFMIFRSSKYNMTSAGLALMIGPMISFFVGLTDTFSRKQ